MLMAIPIGESIVIGSSLFATMGVIIKVISVRAEAYVMKSQQVLDGINGKLPPGISRKSLDQILDVKLKKVVTDPVCLARHQGLERHVSDIFNSLSKQMDDVKGTQERIFDKLDEIKRCQINALKVAK